MDSKAVISIIGLLSKDELYDNVAKIQEIRNADVPSFLEFASINKRIIGLL